MPGNGALNTTDFLAGLVHIAFLEPLFGGGNVLGVVVIQSRNFLHSFRFHDFSEFTLPRMQDIPRWVMTYRTRD